MAKKQSRRSTEGSWPPPMQGQQESSPNPNQWRQKGRPWMDPRLISPQEPRQPVLPPGWPHELHKPPGGRAPLDPILNPFQPHWKRHFEIPYDDGPDDSVAYGASTEAPKRKPSKKTGAKVKGPSKKSVLRGRKTRQSNRKSKGK